MFSLKIHVEVLNSGSKDRLTSLLAFITRFMFPCTSTSTCMHVWRLWLTTWVGWNLGLNAAQRFLTHENMKGRASLGGLPSSSGLSVALSSNLTLTDVWQRFDVCHTWYHSFQLSPNTLWNLSCFEVLINSKPQNGDSSKTRNCKEFLRIPDLLAWPGYWRLVYYTVVIWP